MSYKTCAYLILTALCISAKEYPTFDGWYHNLARPDWGANDQPLFRLVAPAYSDGLISPSGSDRPSPRLISEAVMKGDPGKGSDLSKSALVVYFGQQVVEEILDSQRAHCPVEYFNIPIPKGDPLYDPEGKGNWYIPLRRNRYDVTTGFGPNVPREQFNEITPWIDGGLMYGPNKAWSDALRTFKDGKLAADDTGLYPAYNSKFGLPMVNPPPPRDHRLKDARRFHMLGNPRGNENPMLLSFGVLWWREHNYQATRLKALHPDWDDEELFLEARRWTIALHQKVVTEEWFPVFAGVNLSTYDGYKSSVNPQISHLFQSAAMRIGHTMVTPGLFRRNGQCAFRKTTAATAGGIQANIGRDAIRTCNSFWNPNEAVEESGIGEMFMGMTTQIQEREDNVVTEDLRGFVFGPLEQSRRDLMAINIQRGREHGLPDYNTVRTALGLGAVTSFENITGSWDADKSVANALRNIHNNDLSKIDVWTGGLLETTNGNPGPLFQYILKNQFERIRDGDRFWFANNASGYFTLDEIAEVRSPTNSFRNIILRNNPDIPIGQTSGNCGLQDDIWHAPPAGFCCQQPFQLNLDHVEPCTPPLTYDYFTPSIGQIPGLIVLLVLFTSAVIAALPIITWYRRRLVRAALTKNKTPARGLKESEANLYKKTIPPSFIGIDDRPIFGVLDYCGNGDGPSKAPVKSNKSSGFLPGIISKLKSIMNDENPVEELPDSVNKSQGKPLYLSITPDRLVLLNATNVDVILREIHLERIESIIVGKTASGSGDGSDTMRRYENMSSKKSGLMSMMKNTSSMVLGDPKVCEVLIKIPREYDVWVEFDDEATRYDFVRMLKEAVESSHTTATDTVNVGKSAFVKFSQPHRLPISEENHRHLREMVKTRNARMIELEEFFREVGLRVASANASGDQGGFMNQTMSRTLQRSRTVARGAGNTSKGVATAELSRDEFANAFGIERNSLFVNQIFDYCDKDGNDFVSFREFTNMWLVFAKGSTYEKMRLMFELYDVDGSGFIEKEELLAMLTSTIAITPSMDHVSDEEIQGIAESWYEEASRKAGIPPNGSISFEAFSRIMDDHQDLIDGIKLSSWVSKSTPASKKPIEKRSSSTLASPTSTESVKSPVSEGIRSRVGTRINRKERREGLVRGLTVAHYGGGRGNSREKIGSPMAAKPLARRKTLKVNDHMSPSEPMMNESSKDSLYMSHGNGGGLAFVEKTGWSRLRQYMTDHRQQFIGLFMFFVACILIFIERAYTYAIYREHRGLRSIAGYGVSLTRGAASGQMFCYSLVLLTMCRNIITFLRSTFLGNYIPFDSAQKFHQIVAWTGLFFTLIHCIGHMFNFYNISTQPADDLTCYFRDVYHFSDELPTFFYWVWNTVTGASGIILIFIMTPIYVFATTYTRRNAYNVFWFFHRFHVFFYIGITIHGAAQLVQHPIFYYFFLIPAILYRLDSVFTIRRKSIKLPVVEAELLPSGVTKIVFKKPTEFDYRSGQWVRVACPDLSSREFHPFTLSSAPHEKYLSVHIRAVGPWTHRIRDLYSPAGYRSGSGLPPIIVDGPFGEGHQDWNKFSVACFVGGGIGVTPFASILKDLVFVCNYNAGQATRNKLKKAYFFWVCRSQKQFEWLVELIGQLEEQDVLGVLEVHTFITQLYEKFDLRTTMLYITERQFQKLNDRSLFTGLQSETHFGRPDFFNLFHQIQQNHHPNSSDTGNDYVPAKEIGVFSCGPPSMTLNVDAACDKLNLLDTNGGRFRHHYENF